MTIPTPRPTIPARRAVDGSLRRTPALGARWSYSDGVHRLRPAAGVLLLATCPAEGRLSWALLIDGRTVASADRAATTRGSLRAFALAYLR